MPTKAWNQLWSICIITSLQATTLFVKTPSSPDTPVVTGFGGVFEQYERLGPIKLHAWKKFLAKYEDKYAVDTFFNDYYG